MGIRLYPRTTNVNNLEKLAGVPAGTHSRLEALKAYWDMELKNCTNHYERHDVDYARYTAIHDDPAMGRLDSFLTFGWGKFRDLSAVPDYSGRLMNKRKIRDLFKVNGIQADPDLCEGVTWS